MPDSLAGGPLIDVDRRLTDRERRDQVQQRAAERIPDGGLVSDVRVLD